MIRRTEVVKMLDIIAPVLDGFLSGQDALRELYEYLVKKPIGRLEGELLKIWELVREREKINKEPDYNKRGSKCKTLIQMLVEVLVSIWKELNQKDIKSGKRKMIKIKVGVMDDGKLKTFNRDVSVVKVSQYFVVHEPLRFIEESNLPTNGMIIVHILSGLKVPGNLPSMHSKNIEIAKRRARLFERLPIDWSLSNPMDTAPAETRPLYQQIARATTESQLSEIDLNVRMYNKVQRKAKVKGRS